MKILILGSQGFIGSHLSQYLKHAGSYNVYDADITTFHGRENYFQIDAMSANFDSIFKENFDVCINCTGAANVAESIKNPKKDYYLNTSIVFSILDSMNSYNPKCAFLNLSSAAIYGNPEILPIKEDEKSNPLSPYGFHKLFAENIMQEFSALYSTNTTSLRIFSCFGPGLKKQLFWDAYKKMKASDFSFFGTGEETRDFIYVTDLCDAIEKVINNLKSGFEVFNLASGTETKIKDALTLFKNVLGFEHEPCFSKKVDSGQPRNWRADISKLTSIGFQSKHSLEMGLEEYKNWLLESES